ncbi:MAG: cytochrome c oxidase subunit 4 [Actinobacteria bacterium]|nr:cytochrome c oxidase subunit 4 [Actinomycetota bacterium]MBW3649325.1 cytochrome c oxidase subunit 4 [Actinomycetota bacterium]
MSTTGKLMLGIAGYLLLASVAYWFLSYEAAGSVLLLLSAGLVLITGGYLVVATRRKAPAASAAGSAEPGDAAADHGEHDEYLPHASIWPLGVGAGSVVLANGLALGLWAVVPGSIILVASIFGYARQSRHRD